MKIILLILFMTLAITGCAGNKILIKNDIKKNLSPIGIFVCSSTQIYDNNDTLHRSFIIKTAHDTFAKLLGDKYSLVNLNNEVAHEKIFKKNALVVLY